jgi:hypothetical protein
MRNHYFIMMAEERVKDLVMDQYDRIMDSEAVT